MNCYFCGARIIVIYIGDSGLYIYVCPNYDGIDPHFPKKESKKEG